ncbi:DoxX family protein [Actinoallomurus sp. NBC_01490]|uniref:DoxX family protein n=1 Tax=Actinoallomurus sp. NBC_01490 TaxID=2903557 RepID=UPI002E34590F|nr:DoxX family protein [Actinoallomurus sp. NBC_01490]
MQIIRTIARPLVAAPFMVTGLETLRNPGPRAEKVAPALKPLADRVAWLPSKDPETLVRIQGAIGLGAGALFALGKFERLTTLLLAAEMVPALLTEHRFWKEEDPERRDVERALMLKNAGLFGVLLYAAAAPSRHRPVKAARTNLREARLQAAVAKAEAGRRAERARRKAARRAAHAQRRAVKVGR